MITLKDFHKITNDLRLVGYFPKKSIVDRTIYKFTDKDITYNYLHLSSHMSYEIETKEGLYSPWIGPFICSSPIIKVSKITRKTTLVEDSVELVEVKEEIPIKIGSPLTMVSNYLNDNTHLNINNLYPTYNYAFLIEDFANLSKVEFKNTENGCYLSVSPNHSYCILESLYCAGVLYTHVRSYAHNVLAQANSIIVNEVRNTINRDKGIITGSFRTLISNLKHINNTEENRKLITEEISKFLADDCIRGIY